MSTSSGRSIGLQQHIDSLGRPARPQRQLTRATRPVVSRYDAYTFALRAAFLCHLLQPKQKRIQYAATPPRPTVARQGTSLPEIVAKDFSVVRDVKSARLPKDFIKKLDERLRGVVQGTERMPEYADALVKRSFATFFNEFSSPAFRKGVEKDRKAEDLLLIFYSSATKELQKGRPAGDDSWKLMVDRHVALLVRLLSAILKANDWAKEKPELATRLQTLETKLLRHEKDLVTAAQTAGGATAVEMEVPRSQHVKDMPLVQVVAHIFNKTLPQVQADIDEQRDLWTERAALQDLKMYQAHMSMNTRMTLQSDDFDTDEAYEEWRKAETQDLSQMMLWIVQNNRELARSSPNTSTAASPASRHPIGYGSIDSGYGDAARRISNSERQSIYVVDQPVDMSQLTISASKRPDDIPPENNETYMYIPPDPRTYYKMVLKEALIQDLSQNIDAPADGGEHDGLADVKLLSKQSIELLNELGARWRLPYSSRLVLMLDVVRDMFQERQIDLETLDAAFTFMKTPPQDKKKIDISLVLDRTRWTMRDFVLNQQILSAVHEILLRDLFEQLQRCYDTKPPEIGDIMAILETRIYDDPLFSKTPEDLDRFSDQLHRALQTMARETYHGIFMKEIGQLGDQTEFFHVIQFGKAVIKLVERIQKRYHKTPEIMNVEPYEILIEIALPALAQDLRNQSASIIEHASVSGEDVNVQDGFELYKEMVAIRQLYLETLPGIPFDFDIEELLAEFVWRWIAITDEKITGWVEGAVREDMFAVRTSTPHQPPTEDERHSVSVIDIFRSFHEAMERVVQLNWDNDLHYAKFMTAMSKSFGNGVSRYCELLEQLFIREMDRMTPEQEAAMLQSRQEKWIRMAKDALASKERAEPFQFLPESFVKLNNIEFAMLQLDKLEKEMNAEACAVVINKAEPPPLRRQRKDEVFIFTVKILEAEDLRACDMNGLSDPYVVLVDELQKRLAKTRVINGSLNPRWDETVDIMTNGPVNVIATIWDWDIMGDHDCVGRTAIKLDPSHFKDFLPREYWLDLDTQGRLLVRVSMEGEKDDIQFYFGKTFRALKRTERDMTRKITDKLSAYIRQCLSRRALKALTPRGIMTATSISTVSSWFGKQAPPSPAPAGPTEADKADALKPLFGYFNENFAIMNQTLTSTAMIAVMTRLWKEVLATIESLLVPPLSDKLSSQPQLTPQELDIVFKWLNMLFDFFHAVDEETGKSEGVSVEVLKNPKYHEVKNLNFWYFEPTEALIHSSEAIVSQQQSAAAQAAAQTARNNRASAPGALPGIGSLLGYSSVAKRSKSIMLSRNLGTMRKAKEDKRKEAQAEPSDDMILRILRMRPEAEKYLRDRARQKERLAAVAAAEMIVKQSLASNGMGQRAISGGVGGMQYMRGVSERQVS